MSYGNIIKDLIIYLDTRYEKEFSDFYDKHSNYNLKRKRIDHIYGSVNESSNQYVINKDFHEYLFIIISKLNCFATELDNIDMIWKSKLETLKNNDFLYRSRVKNLESITNKMRRYLCGLEEGRVSINKCLNDLLGFRIVVPNYKSKYEKQILEEIVDIRDNKSRRIKILPNIVTDKYNDNGDKIYSGTHIYINGANNNYFPIEIQIWDLKDLNMNKNSHERYKQKYKQDVGNYKRL